MSLKVKLLPPSPVTDKLKVDIRVGYQTSLATHVEIIVKNQNGTALIEKRPVDSSRFVKLTVATEKLIGDNSIEVRLINDNSIIAESTKTELKVIASPTRSNATLDGAWCGMYHWSEEEGKLWNQDLKNYTENDWRKMVQNMNTIGMKVIVLQELFRNQEYHGKQNIEVEGYHGKAFYPSKLTAARMDINCVDPVEVILSEADKLDMSVFAGIGMYAWFDFTTGSLEWHKKVIREVFELYGHHTSLYGWYISEEVFGDLNYGENTEKEIVEFFHQISLLRNELTPEMPIMLAPNCFYVNHTIDSWKKVASELDIICPFGFHRMGNDDLTSEEVIDLFQQIVDESGSHLWLDLEVFLFNPDMSLYPRPMNEIINELKRFSKFEKILCYQFPGVFSAPDDRIIAGGAATIKSFEDYQNYVTNKD